MGDAQNSAKRREVFKWQLKLCVCSLLKSQYSTTQEYNTSIQPTKDPKE